MLTAREVIARIQREIALPWRESTVDTFKSGDPEAAVTGIAVTMFPTVDVLREAVEANLNLIIAHEPAYYSHPDDVGYLVQENDPVYTAKRTFIDDHGLILWRFHDHWHMRQPDGILEGMVDALGWRENRDPSHPLLFEIPETTVADLADDLKVRLGIKAMRVVGDPQLKVTRPAIAPGAPGFGRHRALLQRDDVEALLIGEITEWETIAYVNDARAAGQTKALVILGHIPSEQAGMEACAHWLTGFVPEVPVQFIPNPEMFWPVY